MRIPAVRSVLQCRQYIHKVLKQNCVVDSLNSTQYIIAHVLGAKTLFHIHPKTKVSDRQWSVIKDLAANRISGEPIQYVLQEWDFRNLVLHLRSPVLIPRPETEELVGHILHDTSTSYSTSFLEVGCGSGAICLSLLLENEKLNGVAVDVSKAACDLTMENASKYHLEKRLKVLNICVSETLKNINGMKFDFIVSNPPYIDSYDMDQLPPEVKNFEDHRALHGGTDGLDIVRKILHLAPSILSENGSVWLEVDSKHPAILKKLNWPGISCIKTINDYRNVPRFCHLQHISSDKA